MPPCPSGKKIYSSESLAIDALIEANVQFEFGNRPGPINIYRCDDCAHYHLTSKGTMNEKLARLIKEGTLGKMRRAAQWENKFRRP